MITFNFKSTLEQLNYEKINDAYKKFDEVKDYVMNESYMNEFIDKYINSIHDKDIFIPIIEKVSQIQKEKAVFIVLAESTVLSSLKAVIEPLNSGITDIYYLGDNLSANSMYKVLDSVKDRGIYLYIIADSMKKPEISAHFRVLKQFIDKKYSPSESKKHIIIASPDSKENESNNKYSESLNVNYDKRLPLEFMAFSQIAFLPFYVAGIDIQKLYSGAKKVLDIIEDDDDNSIKDYVAIRWVALQEGIDVENICTCEPKLESFCEWRGRIPGNDMLYHSYSLYLRDLDNLKYYHNKYKNKIMETFINVNIPTVDIVIRPDQDINNDMAYLDNISFNELNNIACSNIIKEHREEGMYVNEISCRRLSVVNLGTLLFYFILSGFFVNSIILKYSGK